MLDFELQQECRYEYLRKVVPRDRILDLIVFIFFPICLLIVCFRLARGALHGVPVLPPRDVSGRMADAEGTAKHDHQDM